MAAKTVKPARKERSLGWVPLVLMSIGYVICTYFRDTIGPLTSAPGFYRISEETPEPRRGCIIPRASP